MLNYLTSLRGKIVAATGILVLLGLLALTTANVLTSRHHALLALDGQMKALTHAHASEVAAWIASRQQVVKSFAAAVDQPDPLPGLKQAKIAGDVDSAYLGYADKRTAFSETQNLPPRLRPDKPTLV